MLPMPVIRSLLWSCTLGLCGLGLVMVASTTTGRGGDGASLAFVIKQSAAVLIGLAAAVVISRVGVEALRRTLVVALIAIGALGLLLIARVAMRPINGAWRWIDLGPVNIQPVELAKLALIATTAWYLVRVEERVRVNWYGVLLPMAAFGLLAAMVYQTRDLGSVVVLAVVLWTMLFYAGANWFYSLLIGIACVPMVLYVTVFSTAYRRDRILAFLDPMNPDNAAAWHLKQSQIAIGSGNWWGVGLGEGMSKHAYLPENHTDFIYAVICEELGFVGGIVVAAAYLLLTWMGFLVANRSKDRHQRLIAVGATILIAIQAFTNMLVVTGTLPTKGLTLPFVSYGGSSLVVCLVAIGMLDAVARRCPALAPRRSRATERIGATLVARGGARVETNPGAIEW